MRRFLFSVFGPVGMLNFRPLHAKAAVRPPELTWDGQSMLVSLSWYGIRFRLLYREFTSFFL